MRYTGRLLVLVMAKAPVPGRVKTRLCPPLSPIEAAAVARAALADTLETVAGCGADAKVVAVDGPPGDWLPSGVDVIAQRGNGLDERLANAWSDTRHLTSGWGLQIGMDTPQVGTRHLDSLLRRLRDQGSACHGRAVLGAALDGGWWVIGLPGTQPDRVFRGVPMSTPQTGSAQELRLRALGLDVAAAPVRRDIDTIRDLVAVAGQFPRTRTAAVAGRLLGHSKVA
jgi:glycosyltransferase A (GT-A) superfamily protein (DUF2064 family)